MIVKELIDKLQQFDEDKLVLVEATPMRASMALSAGYKIGNAHPDDIGYEVTYPDGLNVGANYAQIKAEDKIWEGLGFVLQWAKYGLKR